MIIRARVVVTMDGPPIENGAVAVSGDRIVDVGKFSEISNQHSTEEVVDLDNQALLPGLINAHCHLDYTCLRGKISRPESFTDWIRAINAEKAKLSVADYVASINEGFAEATRFGTTTIANLTAFPELISRIEPPIRTWWFAELLDVRDPSRANEIVDLAVEKLKSAEHWGLAPHAPFTASAKIYRRCEEIARRENILRTTHLAESREEMSMFRDASGTLYDFLKQIGRDMADCGRKTPLSQFTEIVRECTRSSPDSLAATSRLRRPSRSSHSLDSSTSRLRPATARQALGMTGGWMVVHLNELTESDFDLLKESTTKFSIVHCPRSHEYFEHSPFQFDKLRECGFNICLGTDSLASNEDLSLFAEMRAFQKTFPKVPAEHIFEMVTLMPALALGKPHVLGRIRKNFFADLIAIPIARDGESVLRRTRSTSVFEQIIGFDRPVSWSMMGGEVQANPSP
ncbi:MAG: amidohydrolase family protein [Verrucomicrobiota bacterium]|nr:amidohydrolase family protein [Verrucomicrobiota bacterium]